MARRPFQYVLENSSAQAPATKQKVKQKIDASQHFVCQTIQAVAYDNATGKELCRGAPTDDALTGAQSLSALRVQFAYGSEKISEKSMPLDLVSGTGTFPFHLAAEWPMGSGKEFEVEVENLSGLTVDWAIVLVGELVDK